MVLQDARKLNDKKEDEELDTKSATVCRISAALRNYMAQDRPDLSFCIFFLKGLQWYGHANLERRGQTEGYHQVSQSGEKGWQSPANQVFAHRDNHWAGVTCTRNSMSGVLMHGLTWCINWSSAQSVGP